MRYIDPLGLCATSGDSGGYPGGWVNPGNLWRGIYTGNPNASDQVYDAAIDASADYILNEGGVRGGYIGLGGGGKKPGKGSVAAMGGLRAGWTIDEGTAATIDFGAGLQDRGQTTLLGLGTKPFVSETVGAGGSYNIYTSDSGFQTPFEGTEGGMYGGIANKHGGGHMAVNGENNMAIGINYGAVYGGLLIDPAKVGQNFIDTYHMITGDF